MARARHYNVQLFRSGRKIYTAWPAKPQLKLKARWKYQGRTYRLQARHLHVDRLAERGRRGT